MSEPKRRGRPPKTIEAPQQDEPMRPHLTAEVVAIDDKAQAYALRVWSGQTDTIPRNERVRRVNAALAGQGFTDEQIEAVTLP